MTQTIFIHDIRNTLGMGTYFGGSF